MSKMKLKWNVVSSAYDNIKKIQRKTNTTNLSPKADPKITN